MSVLILAIESSCDETCASVVKDGREVLSSIISSQISIHKAFGGVVPEIASRNHTLMISNVVSEALKSANIMPCDLSAVAVTYGAGLVGALLVGVSFAKAFCYYNNLPLVPVSHIRGHIAANYIEDKELKPPFLCLLASGGHTALLKVDDYFSHTFIGGTKDDAVGEAFDKVAKVLNMEYPGGPNVSKAALGGKNSVPLPKMLKGEKSYDFSYSGLKTAVVNYIHTRAQRGEDVNKNDVCHSFQKVAIDVLVEKSVLAIKEFNMTTLAVAGGVAANDYLREQLTVASKENNFKLVLPKKVMCTDNAAMIGAEGYLQYVNKNFASLELNAKPTIKL